MSINASTEAKVTSTVVAIAWLAAMIPLHAIVFASYWGWFITPHFVSAPDLGFAGAFGLSATVGLLTIKASDYEPSRDDSLAKRWSIRITALLSTLIMWAYGWAAFHVIGWFS